VASPTFKKWIVVAIAISAAVMELIDTSIVNVGLFQMAGNLGVTIEDISWVITSYAIANVIIIPMTGFLQRYFGRKNYFMGSIALFTFASYLCGAANTLPLLIAARFLQGIGGGALLSVSQGILFDSFPPDQRGIASALFGMGIVMGPTFGPTLGGIIIDNYHWSWMFLINLPAGALALFLTYNYLDKKPEELNINRSSIKIDFIGIILLMGWVGPLQYVLERGEAKDWFDDSGIIIFTIITVVSLLLFIWRELTTESPVVDLRVLKNRNLVIGIVLITVIGYGLFTSVFLYPVFAQRIIGFTAKQTGMLLIPGSFISLFAFPFVGRLLAKGTSPRLIACIGYCIFAFFCFIMSRLNQDAAAGTFILCLLFRGFGLAFTNIPLISSSLATLTPRELPMGIALTNMFRQIGGAFGIAITNTYIGQRAALHSMNLKSNVVPGDLLTTERVNAITQGLIGRGVSAFDATQLAYKNLEGVIARQAAQLAYLDAFQLAGFFFVITFPMLFLMQSKKQDAAAAKVAAEAAH
jgi:MFS transporter, DHA2 family, multidrug resistance protein